MTTQKPTVSPTTLRATRTVSWIPKATRTVSPTVRLSRSARVTPGSRLGLVVAAGELAELEAEEDGVGVGVGVFDGFGVGVLVGVGVGVGVGVLEAGSTWQLVSVFALALVEVPALDEAAASRSDPACAVPGRPASTPRVRKPPPSTLSAVTRTCSRRMRIAMSPLLVRVTFCSSCLLRFGGN